MTRTRARRLAPVLALLLLAAAPGAAGRHKRSGNQHLAEGRHEEALAAYRQGLAEAPEDPELHVNAGAALYRLARPREAAEEFRRGMALASEPALRRTALYNEGTALLEAGDAAAAAGRFRQVLLEDPDDDSARRNFEIALARQEGQPQEENEKSGSGEDGQGDKGESSPQEGSGERQDREPPRGDKPRAGNEPRTDAEPPPASGTGERPPQPAGDDGQPPLAAPGDGTRLLTRQEAERLLAAIGQGEKEDLRAALAELTAKPRRAGNPDRDW